MKDEAARTVPAPALDPEMWPEERKPKKRRVDPEHTLQKHIMQFVREELPGSEFFSFDRSAAYGQWSHARQKARGVRRGTPDTLLIAQGKHVWCELKAPGNKPDDMQQAIGIRLIAVGDAWFWATTVTGYATWLVGFGIPMRSGWGIRAADHDARVQGEIERAMMKAGKLPARLQKRATPSRIRRAHAAGLWKAPG